MPRHVFISYAHEDADAAMSFLAALEGRGIKCWIAPRDVPPGGSYAEAILTAIENASCFILVYSQNSNTSRHVLREVERSLSLGINIIPVRFDNSSVSKSLDYLLATVHWLSVIAEPRDVGIGHAAERIASAMAEKDPAAVASPPPSPPPPPPPIPSAPAKPAPRRPSSALLPVFILLGFGLVVVVGIAFAMKALHHLGTSAKASPTPSASPTVFAAAATHVARIAETPAPSVAQTSVATVAETPVVVAAIPSATAPPAEDAPPTPTITPPPVEETEETPAEAVAEATVEPSEPPVPSTRSHESPLGVVRHYYNYLADRNTIKAYELLSSNYRSRENFVTYTRNFASTTSLRLLNAHEVSSGEESARVYVAFEKNNRRFGRIQWKGTIDLTLEPAGWRIESTRGLRPSSR